MEIGNYKILEIKKILDGDTVCVDVYLGFNFVRKNTKIRLARINAPEISNPETQQKAFESKIFLQNLMMNGELILKTLGDKQDKYGRYLGEINVKINEEWVNINDEMLKTGHAVLYKGIIEEEFVF